MRLRLYHHRDGARVAYRETGTGPGLVLLHSLGLSHREWGPVVGPLSGRFRVVLPDLPLHGDSEDRLHPFDAAQEALNLLPDAQLRTLAGAGFLIAYDDPVGLARELIAFCG